VKIILVRDKGVSATIRVHRRTGLGLLTLALVSVVGGAALAWNLFSASALQFELVDDWEQRLEAQAAVVSELQIRAAAENEAVGRQLARMQARLWRMEALGARVSEVANLDAAGFSFGKPVAQGGPAGKQGSALHRIDLQQQIGLLSLQLREREKELELLESLMVDDEYRKTVAPAGRPVTWGWVSSPYGRRLDPISGHRAWHDGVDFAGREGDDVIAVASGVVTFAGEKSGYGNTIEISHANGFSSRYGHGKELLVEVGDVVDKGQRIAVMGSTGRSTGPHVHFEVRKHGRHVDPARYISRI